MREALRESIRVHNSTEDYAKDTIVLCSSCYKPLYRLQRAIRMGDKVSKSIDAYRPMSAKDLLALRARAHHDHGLDPALSGLWRSWTEEECRRMAQSIPPIEKTSQLAICPFCQNSWPYVRASESSEVHDRAYVWELFTIPPEAPIAKITAFGMGLSS